MMHMLQIKDPLEANNLRRSKMGYEFDIFSDEWKLDGSSSIKWSLLKALNLNHDFERGFRETLSIYASEMSARYTFVVV